MRALILAGLIVAGGGAAAQTPREIPRATDGHPDLQGVWSANVATTLERPDDVKTLVVTPEQAKKLIADFNKNDEKVYDPDFDAPGAKIETLLEVNGELRSSLLIEPADGKLPLTALAKAVNARRDDLRKKNFDNPEERSPGERCVLGAGDPPLVFFADLIPSQIIQTPGAIAIGTEDTHGGRVVAMGGTAPPDAVRSRVGYSVGHWEGDTLVVVTDHFSADDPWGVQFRDAAMVSRASRVTEWITMISPDVIRYRFTIEDPALYSGPWLAEVVMKRSKDRLYEYACHEGNYAMAHILLAARLGKQKPPPEKTDDKDKKDAKADAKPGETKPAEKKLAATKAVDVKAAPN